MLRGHKSLGEVYRALPTLGTNIIRLLLQSLGVCPSDRLALAILSVVLSPSPAPSVEGQVDSYGK